VEGLIRQLDLGCEWSARIQALLRAEGLIRGGAAALPGALELLARLQAPIIAQLLDRCSDQAWESSSSSRRADALLGTCLSCDPPCCSII
jgi:hypothetical protein